MNLKITKIIAIIITIIMAVIIYINHRILSHIHIFFPVNKSLWETTKIIFTTTILYGIIDYIIIKKTKIKHDNFLLSLSISSIITIPLYLILNKLNFIILIIIITSISQITNYYIQKRNNIKYLNIASLLLIIITYVIYGYLTYHPPLEPIFYDSINKKYGLKTYII